MCDKKKIIKAVRNIKKAVRKEELLKALNARERLRETAVKAMEEFGKEGVEK